MDSEDLLYNNRFIQPDVGGIDNDRSNLLDYLDQIDNEKNRIEIREKALFTQMEKSKKQNTVKKDKLDFTDLKKYKKTVVSIDSRYRQINFESIKDVDSTKELKWDQNTLTNTSVVSKCLIKEENSIKIIELYNSDFENVMKS